MATKRVDPKNIIPDEHLEDYLKSSYEERLNWLEEANKLTNKVLTKKQKKLRRKLKQKKIGL